MNDAAGYSWLERIVIDPMSDGSDRAIVGDSQGGLIRVSGEIAAMIDRARTVYTECSERGEELDLDRISASLENGWSATRINDTLAAIQRSSPRLASAVPQQRRKWIEYSPPFIVRLSLINPSRLLSRRSVLVRALATRPFAIVIAALWLVGACGAVFVVFSTDSPLNGRIPLWSYFATLGTVYLTVALHELMHAGTLIAYGGTSRRMGFMIFYLLPAFFSEVTDAWRLPPKRRVAVALAGIASQGALAGLVVLAMPFLSGYWQTMAAIFIVVMIAFGLANLIPFLKLDGYIALVGGLDLPHLRQKSIASARAWFARRLVGMHTVPPLTQRWAVPFGIACGVAPIFMFVLAVQVIGSNLWAFGRIAPIAQLATIVALLLFGLVFLVRGSMRLRREGARRSRVAGGYVLPILAVTVGLAALPFPWKQGGSYVMSDGQPAMVLGPSNVRPDPGTKITLTRVGLGRPAPVGTARVSTHKPVSCDVPLSALAAVDADPEQKLSVRCIPLVAEGAGASRSAGQVHFWIVRSMLHRGWSIANAAFGRD